MSVTAHGYPMLICFSACQFRWIADTRMLRYTGNRSSTFGEKQSALSLQLVRRQTASLVVPACLQSLAGLVLSVGKNQRLRQKGCRNGVAISLSARAHGRLAGPPACQTIRHTFRAKSVAGGLGHVTLSPRRHSQHPFAPDSRCIASVNEIISPDLPDLSVQCVDVTYVTLPMYYLGEGVVMQ